MQRVRPAILLHRQNTAFAGMGLDKWKISTMRWIAALDDICSTNSLAATPGPARLMTNLSQPFCHPQQFFPTLGKQRGSVFAITRGIQQGG